MGRAWGNVVSLECSTLKYLPMEQNSWRQYHRKFGFNSLNLTTVSPVICSTEHLHQPLCKFCVRLCGPNGRKLNVAAASIHHILRVEISDCMVTVERNTWKHIWSPHNQWNAAFGMHAYPYASSARIVPVHASIYSSDLFIARHIVTYSQWKAALGNARLCTCIERSTHAWGVWYVRRMPRWGSFRGREQRQMMLMPTVDRRKKTRPRFRQALASSSSLSSAAAVLAATSAALDSAVATVADNAQRRCSVGTVSCHFKRILYHCQVCFFVYN